MFKTFLAAAVRKLAYLLVALLFGLVVAWLSGCAALPSKHERAAFLYLGPCNEVRDGARWCAVVNRGWDEPMPWGF